MELQWSNPKREYAAQYKVFRTAWQNARWTTDGHGQFQIRGSPLLFSFFPWDLQEWILIA